MTLSQTYNGAEYVLDDRGGVYVDVGEKTMFYVEVEGAVLYTPIHSTPSRVLFRTSLSDGTEMTLRVSWSMHKRVAHSRGYRGMEICRDILYVPSLYTRDLHVVGSTFVEVSTRQYIEGRPLSEVWCDMDDTERYNISYQVEKFMESMSEIQHTNFMALQGKNLSTPRPVEYLGYKIILSLITKELESGDCTTMDMDNFPLTSNLCHGALSMDHIITKDSLLAGIVGWSKCDFIPEVMDRMRYHFAKPTAEGETAWYSHLSSVLLFHPAPPPLYTVACARYCYMLRMRSTPDEYHHRLSLKLEEAYRMLMPASRQSMEGIYGYNTNSAGDQGSLSRHDEVGCHTDSSPFSDTLSNASSGTSSSADTSRSFLSWSDNSTVIEVLNALGVGRD